MRFLKDYPKKKKRSADLKLTSLHLLLTYQCVFECDHCFVWGSPKQSGTMTFEQIREILRQAHEPGTIESIYFEGGEPFLYYPVLVEGVQEAARQGFQTGIVSNAFWATNLEDAIQWLRPFAGLIQDLSVSSDLFHWTERISQNVEYVCKAAEALGIPVGMIEVSLPEATNIIEPLGQLPQGASRVMYRGRAAEELIGRVTWQPWERFTKCPHEDLQMIGRGHLDPLGNLHACQGISIGNIFEKPLEELIESYNYETHPVIGSLVEGGPVELVRRFGLSHSDTYADACHLCYTSRQLLRVQFPEILTPDQMYGVF
jgi:MoaA/NifB/PqqE/SkfB family radical SAM enzyme